jgi:hypothetical protein
MATQHVWPGLDRAGNSLTVYAEDGVTLIPAAGGAIVPWVKYYEDLVNAFTLRTSDPLDLSGDPIEIGDVGGISEALVGITVADLSIRQVSGQGETVYAVGLEVAGDGGGGLFFGALGSSATPFGGMVVEAPGGRWHRATDGSTLNIRWFGGMPDGRDCIPAVAAALAWAESDAAAADDVIVTILFPAERHPSEAKARSYRLASPIIPPANNHRRIVLVGEGTSCPPDYGLYGSAPWLSPILMSGTCLQADPNVHAVLLNNPGGAENTPYRRFAAKDIAILASGTGECIRMYSAVEGDQSGLVELDNVFLGGGKVGFRCNSTQNASHFNVVIRGCETGLTAGNPGGGSSCASQNFFGPDIQACGAGVDIYKVLSFAFYGGLVQGNDVQFKFRADASARNVFLSVPHVECAGSQLIIDCDPAATEVGVTFHLCRFAKPAGTYVATTLYANGWNFLGCVGSDEWVVTKNEGSLSIPDCRPFSVVLGPLVDFLRNPKNYPERALTNVSGAIGHDWGNQGEKLSIYANGNITLNAPTNAVRGATLLYMLEQDETGGHTVTMAANVLVPSYSNTGNTLRKKCSVEIIYYGSGIWYEKAVGAWS